MKINHRLTLVFATITASFIVGNAAAHIKNEASQFPDIEFADARFDVVLLVGAGIIPETPVFEPDAPFTRVDLATWGALAEDLGKGGETPDTDALATVALKQGLVASLDGQATYEDINRLFFRGQLTPDRPAAVPTRGEAASFIATHLGSAVGEALLARRGVRMGPAGHTAKVEIQRNPDGGNTYMITIGDTSLPMFAHGRVANGPTDLIQWDGRNVRRSFIRERGDLAVWIYLEAEPLATPESDGTLAAIDEQPMPQASTDRRLLYGLVAAASGLGLILFFQGRRNS